MNRVRYPKSPKGGSKRKVTFSEQSLSERTLSTIILEGSDGY